MVFFALSAPRFGRRPAPRLPNLTGKGDEALPKLRTTMEMGGNGRPGGPLRQPARVEARRASVRGPNAPKKRARAQRPSLSFSSLLSSFFTHATNQTTVQGLLETCVDVLERMPVRGERDEMRRAGSCSRSRFFPFSPSPYDAPFSTFSLPFSHHPTPGPRLRLLLRRLRDRRARPALPPGRPPA